MSNYIQFCNNILNIRNIDASSQIKKIVIEEKEKILNMNSNLSGYCKYIASIIEERLKEILTIKGCERVEVMNLATTDTSKAIATAFAFDKIVVATTTYNGEIFPFMREFIYDLIERNFQNRTVGFIENGSWAPMATRVMQDLLGKCKNLRYLETKVTILSAPSVENYEQINALANELCKDKEGKYE